MAKFIKLIKNSKGATAIEYGLIAALIAVAAIAAMQNAWKGEVSDYDDEFYPAKNAIMTPRPAQRPGPPIWIGGWSAVLCGKRSTRIRAGVAGWCVVVWLSYLVRRAGSPRIAWAAMTCWSVVFEAALASASPWGRVSGW